MGQLETEIIAAGGLVSIGECMVELARTGDGRFQISYGGDTFNTAIYAARVGRHSVTYVTALGQDPYSDAIAALASGEGVRTALIARVPKRQPGLYLIETENGERRFWYWRDRAPAREMFRFLDLNRLEAALAQAAVVYVSGITLSILDAPGRDVLADQLLRARMAGARIAMDANFRPMGWPGPIDETRETFARFWRLADIALPSLDDEAAIWGAHSVDDACERLHGFGVGEVVIKCGADGATLSRVADEPSATRETVRITCPAVIEPTDTTAAGDSFNGAYLAARMTDETPIDSIGFAHAVAGEVVRHPGAIVPMDATESLSAHLRARNS